jgi:hypothetical protein
MTKRIKMYPTMDEMAALDAAARRNRARMLRAMYLKGVRALKWTFVHLTAASAPNRVSHA